MNTQIEPKSAPQILKERGAKAEEREAPTPPVDAPWLQLAGIEFGAHVLAFSRLDERVGMPKGVVRLELYYVLHKEHGHAPLQAARYWRSFVQSPIRVEFGPEHDKLTATYYARWANAAGDVGPWSAPVSRTIVV